MYVALLRFHLRHDDARDQARNSSTFDSFSVPWKVSYLLSFFPLLSPPSTLHHRLLNDYLYGLPLQNCSVNYVITAFSFS